MELQFVLDQIDHFNRRNFDLLFSKYYSKDLRVFSHPGFSEFRDLISVFGDTKKSDTEKRQALEKVVGQKLPNIFPDLEVLKGHVRKQFSSPLELHVDVLESAQFSNYVVLFERKRRDGIVVDAADIYCVEGGFITKMWIAKADT